MNLVRPLLPALLLVVNLCSVQADSTLVHRVEADASMGLIIQSNRYLRGNNPQGRKMTTASVGKLKYALQMPGDTLYGGCYQGVGVAVHGVDKQLGHPVAVFLHQGAPLVQLSPSVSVNYEWNLGLSFGWDPYDEEGNKGNHVLGSRVNAYIGGDVYLRWHLNRHWDLNAGYAYSHFSNANLEMPNEGLNIMGPRMSLAYYTDRGQGRTAGRPALSKTEPRNGEHWYTDIVVYGGWRKKSLVIDGTFGVGGIQATRMYRLNHAFAIGPSLDAVYDRSMELETRRKVDDTGMPVDGMLDYTMPSWNKQVAVGASAHIELTMPVFRANAGAGYYALGGFTGFYETLALKADIAPHVFLNIGYCLYNYHYSNNLMLGLGITI